MNKIIKDSIRRLLDDRPLSVVLALLSLLAVGMVVYIAFTVRPSELQLVSRYSAFGITHLYREQWFYLLSFAIFGVMVAALHAVIAIKTLLSKDHSTAMMIAWLGVAILLLTYVTAGAVINVWSPL